MAKKTCTVIILYRDLPHTLHRNTPQFSKLIISYVNLKVNDFPSEQDFDFHFPGFIQNIESYNRNKRIREIFQFCL